MKKPRVNRSQIWVGLLVLAACLLVFLVNSGKKSQDLPRAQYSDSSPLGGLGLRLVMEKLGFSTARQTLPLQKMPVNAKIWLLLDPQTGFSRQESQILLSWVKQGGILVFCLQPEAAVFSFDGEAENVGVAALRERLRVERSQGNVASTDLLPTLNPLSLDTVSMYRSGVKSSSGSSRKFERSTRDDTAKAADLSELEVAGSPGGTLTRLDLGKGHVFVAPDALLFTNYALSHADNAVFVTNLLRAHTAPIGSQSAAQNTIYFDERKHGDDAAPINAPLTLIGALKKPPASYAVLQILFAGLLFWAFAGRRLGAPVPIPSSGPVTRASQFAGAMGALFLKTNRPQAAAKLIGARFRRRLAARLGLSPAENDAVLARRAQEVAGIPFEVTDRLLLQTQAPPSNLNQALRDAQEMERVLQILEGRNR